MKSLLRSGPVTSLLGFLIWLWMALIGRTVRWTVEGDEIAKAHWAKPGGVMVAAWHSRILLLPSGWTRMLRKWPGRTAPVAMLISLSKDGEAVAKAIKHLGLADIRGSKANKRKKSKDKGGARAIAEAVRLLKSGGALCITPDGPRGPAEIVSLGPILLAQRSGATILPYALASAPAKRFASWDQFILPFPFTRGAIVFGEPLLADKSMSAADLQQELQIRMDRTNARAEEIVGLRGFSRPESAGAK